jgi:hypothetical protein
MATPRRRRTDRLSAAPKPSTSSEDVARRAYELFLSRGAEHGRDIDDWLQAERELVWENQRAELVRAS